jgi:hypothetical protein
MKTLTARQLQFRFGLAFAFNAALLMALPETMRTTGEITSEAMKIAVIGLLAAGALGPSLTLLRVGNSWQKSAAVLFLCLPVWALWWMGVLAVDLW